MFLLVFIIVIAIVCGSLCAVYQPNDYQKELLKTLQRIDGSSLYVLDYDYDYDIDELMERGVSSTVDMLAYATEHLLKNNDDYEFKINEEGKFACSTFNAETPDGDKIFARNFDYYKSPTILVWLHADKYAKPGQKRYASINTVNGNFLLYTTEITPEPECNRTQLLLAPYACMDGMNSAGLSIAILELDNDPINQDNGKPDMNNSCIVRAVLDTCATVDEAIALFNKYDMHDLIGCQYHYQIADATGKSVVLEYDTDGVMHIFAAPERGDVDYTYLTNYYYSYPADHEAQENCMGWDRTLKIEKALSAKDGKVTVPEAMSILDSVHLDEYEKGAIAKVVTVWSNIFNQSKGEVTVSVAMDFSKSWTFSIDKPCQVIRSTVA